MKKFPGTIKTVEKSHRYILNKEQEDWLRDVFPVTENNRIAKAMGVSMNRLHGFAREYSLAKSEEGRRAIQKRQTQRMAATCERTGVYARKRGHPVSKATMEGNLRMWQLIREGKAESPKQTMKRERPADYERMIENMSRNRKEMIRKEKRRVLYGMERKTNLRPVVMCPYKRSQIHHRYNALKRGYLLDADCSEGTAGRYVIYYDDETQRNKRFEQNLIKDGFTLKRDE